MEELDKILAYATEHNDLDSIAPLVKGISEAQEASDKALGEAKTALEELQGKYNSLSDWTISALKRQPAEEAEAEIDDTDVKAVSAAIEESLESEEA